MEKKANRLERSQGKKTVSSAMGCELGKLASSGDSKKEVENNVNEPPAPQAPDPRLPLTARQKYSMVASWKGISRAMETTGINMFIK